MRCRTPLSIVYNSLRSEIDGYVRRRLFGTVFLVTIAGVFGAFGPLALKAEVDRLSGAPLLGSRRSDILLVCLYVLSQFTSRAVTELRGVVYARAERRLLRAVSARFFSHLLRLPLAYHWRQQIGAAGQLLENGLQGLVLILHHMVFTVLPVGAELSTTIIILAHQKHMEFLGIFCVAVASYTGVFLWAAARTGAAAREASAARVKASGVMTDALLNCETLKAFAAEQLAEERIARVLKDTEAEWIRFFALYGRNGFMVAALYALFLGVTVSLAAWEVSLGRMTVGQFVLVNTYTLSLLRPVEMLGYAVQALTQGMCMLEKLVDVLNVSSEPYQSTPVLRRTGPASLEFRDVVFSYNQKARVLDGVTCRLDGGKVFGLVGASGAGKSTLIRLLGRHYEPDCGQILIDGLPIQHCGLQELRRSIVIVSQDVQLINDSLLQNIRLGRPDASIAEIEQAAAIAQLHETIMRLPDGYNTLVGERGCALSGGQRQRVSVARAVLARPRVLVLDEGTSQLDSITEQRIQSGIAGLAQTTTVIIVTHRLSTLLLADRVAVMQDGKIIENGPHNELVRSGGVYAALWMAQGHGQAVA